MNPLLGVPRFLLRRVGLDVVTYAGSGSLADARRLKVIDLQTIDVVLDVGAADGAFSKKLRQSGYTGRIISFEPLTEAYDALLTASRNDGRWDAVHAAIGREDGEAMINVSARQTSSSLLVMLPAHLSAAPDSAYVANQKVPLRRLDSALKGLVVPADRLYLKIDVQGYEHAVLQGALETLKATRAIEVEVSMVPLYEGSPLYAETIASLSAAGFSLISWEDVFTDPHTGYVLQADCMFARDLASR